MVRRLLISSTLLFSLSVHVSYAAETDYAVYRASTAGESVDTSLVDMDWDTTVYQGSGFTLGGSNILVDLADTGHYLMMYNLGFSRADADNFRSELQGLIDLAGTDIAYGRSSCYIRNSGGTNSCWLAGSAIISATAGQDVKIEAQSTDDHTSTPTRINDESGLMLLRLGDSWDYARIQEAGGGQAFDSATFSAMTWDTNDELDAGSFARSGADITLKTVGHYLVTVNVMFNTASASARRNVDMRLTLDSSEIAGTRTTTYLRGTDSTQDHTAVYIGIIETTSTNQVLNVEAACNAEDCTGTNITNVGGQSAITLARLPDDAEYIRLHEAGGGQALDGSDDPILWDTEDEEDAASFSHDTGSNTSRININKNGGYLLLASFFSDRTSTTNGARLYPHWEWAVDGAIQPYGSFGKFNRGDQSTTGTWTAGDSGGVILHSLTSSNYVELTNTDVSTGSDSLATFIANRYAVQGVNILSLFKTDVTTAQGLAQPTYLRAGLNDEVLGAFSFIAVDRATNLTALTVNEEGSLDADAYLTNVRLYAQQEATCTFAGSSQIGTASVFNTSDEVSFTGLSLTVGTSTQQCVFVVADVSASATGTMEIELTSITDPVFSNGNAAGTFPLALTGSSTVRMGLGTIMSQELDYDWVSGMKSWENVYWGTTETQGDVALRVYYTNVTPCDTLIPDAALPGNAAGFQSTSSPLSLSALNTTTYNRICLHATLTAGATASPTLNDWRVTWFGGPLITARETVDDDADGFIDHIRITADENLDDDFSALTMTVAGYTLDSTTPYITNIGGGGANDAIFYIDLDEGASWDTDATPLVTLTANTSLSSQVGGIDLPTDAGVTPDDDVGPVLVLAKTQDVGLTAGIFNEADDRVDFIFSEPLSGAPTEAQLEAALTFAGGATDGDNLPSTGTGSNPVSLVTNVSTDDTIRVAFNSGNTANVNLITPGTHTVSVSVGTNITDLASNTANTAAVAINLDALHAYQMALCPEPSANRIGMATLNPVPSSADARLEVGIWDGTSWGNVSTSLDTSVQPTEGANLDCAWIGTTGELVVVYNDGETDGDLDWVSWTSGGGWVSGTDYSYSAGTETELNIELENFPGEDKIMAKIIDSDNDLRIFNYDGTWSTPTGGNPLKTAVNDSTRGAPADVGLTPNAATPIAQIGNVAVQREGDAVKIAWSTQTESEVQGFRIVRMRKDGGEGLGAGEAGEWEVLTDQPVPAMGGAMAGHEYAWIDLSADRKMIDAENYIYRLEVIGKGSDKVVMAVGALTPDPTGRTTYMDAATGEVKVETIDQPLETVARVSRTGSLEGLENVIRGPAESMAANVISANTHVAASTLSAAAARAIATGARADASGFIAKANAKKAAKTVERVIKRVERKVERIEKKAEKAGVSVEELIEKVQEEAKEKLEELKEKLEELEELEELNELSDDDAEEEEEEEDGIEGDGVWVDPGPIISPQADFASIQDGVLPIKIRITEPGLMRVKGSDLETAGWSLEGLDPKSIFLRSGHYVVPFRLVGLEEGEEGVFESDDYIEFWTEPIETRYYNENIYWISQHPLGGKRVEEASMAGVLPGFTALSYDYMFRLDGNEAYYSESPSNAHWFFDWEFWSYAGISESWDYVVEATDFVDTGSPAKMKLGIQGMSTWGWGDPYYNKQEVTVYFDNGSGPVEIGSHPWNGDVYVEVEFDVPSNLFQTGVTEYTVTVEPSVGPDEDIEQMFLLEYIHLTYSRALHSAGDGLVFQVSAPGYSYDVKKFPDDSPNVYLLRKNGPVVHYSDVSVLNAAEGYTVSLVGSAAGADRYVVVPESAVKTPDDMELSLGTPLQDQEDFPEYIIVAPIEFHETLTDFVAHREAQLIDVQDAYDQFSHGFPHPVGLRRLLLHVADTGAKMVLLVGDGHFDYRDFQGSGVAQYIPVAMMQTEYGEMVSDAWFGTHHNELVPRIALGRWPVQTVDQLNAVIAKTLAYEAGPNFTKSVAIADNEPVFHATANRIQNVMPQTDQVTLLKYGLGELDKPTVQSGLFTAVNTEGVGLMSYVGHGGIQLWSSARLLQNSDLNTFTNGVDDEFPVLLALGCLSGFFAYPADFDSLAEVLLTADDKGIVATISPSGLTSTPEQQVLALAWLRAALYENQTLGEALLSAYQQTTEALPSNTASAVIRTFNLLGDPALELKIE